MQLNGSGRTGFAVLGFLVVFCAVASSQIQPDTDALSLEKHAPLYPLQPGQWPVVHEDDSLPFSGSNMTLSRRSGTNEKALIYTFWSMIDVKDAWGQSLPGWPKDYHSPTQSSPLLYDPVAGDIDGDGDLEVLVIARYNSSDLSFIMAWHMENGHEVTGWPVYFESSDPLRCIALGDLEGDGTLEVIAVRSEVTNFNDFVYAFRGDGKLADGWPAMATDTAYSKRCSLSVGDIDCDGHAEIVASFGNERLNDYQPSPLFVFEDNGDLKWKKMLDGYIIGAYLGDMDGDPELEIVTVYNTETPVNNKDTYTTSFNPDGSMVPGWEPIFWKWPSGDFVLADLNMDGKVDVLVKCSTQLIAYHNDGSVLWEKSEVYAEGIPIVADVCLDDRPEILFSAVSIHSNIYYGRIMVLSSEGKSLFSITLPEEYISRHNSGVVGDLDGDGDVEVMYWTYFHDSDSNEHWYSRYRLYAWDLKHPYHAGSVDWPMYMHDAKHTGLHD
jgi:hypothetical protein